jgi:hypothetical protein
MKQLKLAGLVFLSAMACASAVMADSAGVDSSGTKNVADSTEAERNAPLPKPSGGSHPADSMAVSVAPSGAPIRSGDVRSAPSDHQQPGTVGGSLDDSGGDAPMSESQSFD